MFVSPKESEDSFGLTNVKQARSTKRFEFWIYEDFRSTLFSVRLRNASTLQSSTDNDKPQVHCRNPLAN